VQANLNSILNRED